MDSLAPILMNFLEEHGRPPLQEKVTEEVDENKVDLKRELPGSIAEQLQGPDTNPIVSQVADGLGDKLVDHIKSITEAAVEVASEGMDLLLTDGIMNIARGILMKQTEEEGNRGFNMDFLNQGKEGMIQTTMVASGPVIKQVSGNIGHKISAHIPARLATYIQEYIDDHGGASGFVGTAAGLIAKFMGGSDDEDDDDDGPDEENQRAIEASGGKPGPIQRMLKKLLSPKILEWVKPYMEKFEKKLNTTLESELRGKIFSVDYIKQKAFAMLTGISSEGGGGGFGGLLSSFITGKIGGGDDDDDDKPKKSSGGDDDDDNDKSDPMQMFGSLASQFLKNREG
ncbi:hypothetical protein BGZ76_001005 [Entomortierella beljakovae]|nr:hypothetical protein BGZ76_001005 [Entomortierella beljakovae]